MKKIAMSIMRIFRKHPETQIIEKAVEPIPPTDIRKEEQLIEHLLEFDPGATIADFARIKQSKFSR